LIFHRCRQMFIFLELPMKPLNLSKQTNEHNKT
jgi:hypothetical protein